jgi:YidC/Oxa1 family membrane protein insertase
VSIGSLDPKSPYKMAVEFDSQGAAVARVELNSYNDIADLSGYLGHLGLSRRDDGAAVVNVVGRGTPAALASPENTLHGVGLKPGDAITAIDGQPVDVAGLESKLKATHPDQQIKLTVERPGVANPITYNVKLIRRPLEVVRPETPVYPSDDGGIKVLPANPLSLLMTLDTVGTKSVRGDASEIGGLPSLFSSNWELDEQNEDSVQFSFTLDDAALKSIGQTGGLKIIKRYELAKIEQPADLHAYHLAMKVEIQNLGEEPQKVAYRLQGPTGAPLEGWWYSTKLHPRMWFGAGARDIVYSFNRDQKLLACPEIYSESLKKIKRDEPPTFDLLKGDVASPIDYVGLDTQFFAAIVKPLAADNHEIKFRRVEALPVEDVNEIPKNRQRTLSASALLVSEQVSVESGQPLVHEYEVFFGPKDPDVLGAYELRPVLEYGWSIFAVPAKGLGFVLHFLQSITHNYGIAIILLTIIVRSCMVPLSLRQAKSAAMMQQLAPEIQKIKDKHPDDAMKQHAAVQELYKKHKFNPFGGCLLVFIQLPIFIGLYRCLSVDIDLRDAALFPGIDWITWCSNLAGPDKLFNWKDWTWDIISDEAAGWFGPYFNVLPLITVALFLVQQKLFTPPATDEQTKMQQQMMTYMTVFMGIMFYKVPAGLCLYFITSSLWGICERKLLPKPKPPSDGGEGKPAPVKPAATSTNGSAKPPSTKKKQKK